MCAWMGALFQSLSDTGASEREDDEMNGILWKDPSSDSQHLEFQTRPKRLHFPRHFLGVSMLIIQNCLFLYYSMPLKMPDVGHALGSFVGP